MRHTARAGSRSSAVLIVGAVLVTSAFAAPEGAPCNAAGETALAYGDVSLCNISDPFDSDVFSFDGAAGERIVIHGSGVLSTSMEACPLLFAPGEPVTTPAPGTPCTAGLRISASLAVTGTYRILVFEHATNEAGDYGLTLERVHPSSPTAVPITFPADVTDELNPESDDDVYSFAGVDGAAVSIAVDLPDSCLDLYAPDGSALAGPCNLSDVRTQVDATLASTGTYTVVVSSMNLRGTGPRSYRLTATSVTPTTTTTSTTSPPVCGNGVLEVGEACDDGSPLGEDCCTALCQLAPDTAACNDGDGCTIDDRCTAGVCTGAAASNQDGDALCDPIDPCPTVPSTGGGGDADGDGIDDDCDDCPSEPNPDQRNTDGAEGGDVCDPCPALAVDTCDPDQSGGVSLDAAGGTLLTSDGRVGITVPPGALGEPTSLSITESVPQTRVATSSTALRKVIQVDLHPEGRVFAQPVTVRFGWDDANDDGVVDGSGALFELREANLRVWRNGMALTGPCGTAVHQQPGCVTACAGRRCCCDLAANSWTLDVIGFSEYVVGDFESVLIPGGGSSATDCLVEWDVVDPYETNGVDRRGAPGKRRTCVDGDRLCDADAVTNGRCIFRIAACANVADERVVKRGAPVCGTAGLARAIVRMPKPNDRDPVRAAAGVAIRDLLVDLGPATIGGIANEVVTYGTPVATPELCASHAELEVPIGPQGKGKLGVAVRAESLAATVDSDRINLACVAGP